MEHDALVEHVCWNDGRACDAACRLYLALSLCLRTPPFTYQCGVGPWAWLVAPTCRQCDAIYYFYIDSADHLQLWMSLMYKDKRLGRIWTSEDKHMNLLESLCNVFLDDSSRVKWQKRPHYSATHVFEAYLAHSVKPKQYFRRFNRKKKRRIYPKYNGCVPSKAHWSLVSLLEQTLVRASLISLVPRDDIFSHLFWRLRLLYPHRALMRWSASVGKR